MNAKASEKYQGELRFLVYLLYCGLCLPLTQGHELPA